jgi:hypothetical protein
MWPIPQGFLRNKYFKASCKNRVIIIARSGFESLRLEERVFQNPFISITILTTLSL